jgi:hypothetical protein
MTINLFALYGDKQIARLYLSVVSDKSGNNGVSRRDPTKAASKIT